MSERYTLKGDGVALITGASSGLGVEFAQCLCRRGYDLMLVARREERLQSLARHLHAAHGKKVWVCPADLAQTGAAQKVADFTQAHKLDIALLVNNAGSGDEKSFVEQPLARQREMLHLNTLTLTQLCRHYLPHLQERGGGGIINVSSVAAFFPLPGHAVYAASKAYVNSFSQALAAEAAPNGVMVLAFCPGPTDTEFSEVAGVNAASHGAAGFFMMNARQTVHLCLAAFDRGEHLAVAGTTNELFRLARRVLPDALLGRVAHLLMNAAG